MLTIFFIRIKTESINLVCEGINLLLYSKMSETIIPIDKISSSRMDGCSAAPSSGFLCHNQAYASWVIGDSFRQYFSFTLSNQDYKGAHGLSSRLSIALALNSIIVISIFIYKLLD